MNFFDWRPSFDGGTHPPDFKETTNSSPVETIPVADSLAVPLNQHAGSPALPVVEAGEAVARGQLLGEASDQISAPVHAPVAGEVKQLKKQLLPSGSKSTCVVIDVDRKNEAKDFYSAYNTVDEPEPEQIVNRVREAGVVGLGGAGFPTHVKLDPPEDRDVDTVVLNGCECEPFLTSDHRRMVQSPEAVVDGLRLIMRTLGAERGVIGVEDNKQEAAERLREITRDESELEVELVETKYPHGVENMLIYSLTGREMSASQLPADVGVGVNNVNTAAAVADAVLEGKPLIERPVTVSGPGVEKPGNYLVPVGTSFKHLLEQAQINEESSLVLDGGPMMGTPQSELEVPTVKATAGVTALTEEFIKQEREHPCIRCARCVSRCPQKLVPTKLAKLIKAEDFDRAGELDVNNCLECGVCSYVCPSNIPLVHWLRLGKEKT